MDIGYFLLLLEIPYNLSADDALWLISLFCRIANGAERPR